MIFFIFVIEAEAISDEIFTEAISRGITEQVFKVFAEDVYNGFAEDIMRKELKKNEFLEIYNFEKCSIFKEIFKENFKEIAEGTYNKQKLMKKLSS